MADPIEITAPVTIPAAIEITAPVTIGGIGGGGSGASWGSITGTLSSQTDLQAALDAKAASNHAHAQYVTTANPILSSGALTVGTITMSALSAGYFCNALGSSSFAVDSGPAANIRAALGAAASSDLHNPVTVTGNGITLTGQQIALSIGTGATQVAQGNHSHALLDSATASATPSTLVLRDASGNTKVSRLSVTGTAGLLLESATPEEGVVITSILTGEATAEIVAGGNFAMTANSDGTPDKLANGTITGATTVEAGATWTYGTGAAAVHRTALGLDAELTSQLINVRWLLNIRPLGAQHLNGWDVLMSPNAPSYALEFGYRGGAGWNLKLEYDTRSVVCYAVRSETDITASGDIEATDSTKGVILKSPDGTRYRVTVANGGTLQVTAV